MTAPLPLSPERDVRGPGCDERCVVVKALLPGVFGRSELLLHDPDAHQDYGRVLGAAGGRAAVGTSVVETGALAVDIDSSTVTLDGRLVTPTMTELRILFALAKRVGRVATHAEIAARTWGYGTFEMPVESYRHAVRVNMTRLRRRLHPHGGLISTVPQLGYRLEALPIDAIAPTPSENYHLRIDGWATDWDCCRSCGLTDLPHTYGGYCVSCVEHRAPRERRRAAADWHAQAARIALATRPEGL